MFLSDISVACSAGIMVSELDNKLPVMVQGLCTSTTVVKVPCVHDTDGCLFIMPCRTQYLHSPFRFHEQKQAGIEVQPFCSVVVRRTQESVVTVSYDTHAGYIHQLEKQSCKLERDWGSPWSHHPMVI